MSETKSNLQRQLADTMSAVGPFLVVLSLMPNALAETAAPYDDVKPDQSESKISSSLSLSQALEVALGASHELKAASLEMQGSEARLSQAGLIPNPSLDTDVETVPSSKTEGSSGGVDLTVTISQPIELGGKRSKRQKVADLERGIVDWSEKSKRFDIVNEVTKLFVDVISAQERVGLADARMTLAQDFLAAAAQRVRAGKGSNLDEAKAKIALTSAQIEAEKAAQTLDAARERLAISLGDAAPKFTKVEGKLDLPAPLPKWADLAARIQQNPDLKRLSKEQEQKLATLELERGKQTPDITLKGGVKYAKEGGSVGYLAGISIPLPLFDRNQGGIREASVNVEKALQEHLAAEQKSRASLQDAYATSEIAWKEAEALQSRGIPEAQKAFDAARHSYEQGRLNYLEVLDAQKTFFETKAQFIESLVVCLKTNADLQRLLGGELVAPTAKSKE